MIIRADARALSLADECIQCVITNPAGSGELGPALTYRDFERPMRDLIRA